MAVFAHKHGDESNDALMQRFKKQIQKAGFIKTLRDRSRLKKKKTKRMVRQAALKREEYRAKNKKKQFYSNM